MRNPNLPQRLFVENRKRLCEHLNPNSLVVLNSNEIWPSNADATHAFQQNNDLYYLTGIRQEETCLLLYPDADDVKMREILFLREPNEQLATWEGHKLTKEEARSRTGIRRIEWNSQFPSLFHRLMCECEFVYLNSNEHKRAGIDVETRDNRFARETQNRYPLHNYQRLAPLLHRLRAVKSHVEIDLVQKAIDITRDAFLRVLRFVKPGVNETEIEAEFAHEFIRQGGGFAYPPIIASGANACVLHYSANDQKCRKGDLLLLDVGASYAGYNADMTRIVPVSGKFTRKQKRLYRAVQKVLQESSDMLQPGLLLKDWQKAAEEFMQQELLSLKILQPSEIQSQDPEQPAVKKYFMHGLGHPLGLDVHDVGITHRPIQEGWILTCEPGCYLREEGIGIRLENDLLVTRSGPVNLMSEIPLDPDEIEHHMNG